MDFPHYSFMTLFHYHLESLGMDMAHLVKTVQRLGWMTAAWLSCCGFAVAQSVCLPAPRLLNTVPMGGQAGTTVEVTISGEFLEDPSDLLFSHSGLSGKPKLNAEGKPEANRYLVTIAADCPVGVYEARLMTRMGLSSSRIFSVSNLSEVQPSGPNKTLATAFEMPMNSICNGTISDRAIDYYSFQAKQGQRVVVDCATRGIDSKLNATVILADELGRDLLVERRGGVLDFSVPKDGKYVIKVHELTFKGGAAYFYRLGLWEQQPGTPIVRQPGTQPVHAFSWPPTGLGKEAELAEVEPNHGAGQAQRITLPCDLQGSFFPAADVDVFEFEAKKGEEWWIEVASERLGLATDPAILVQQVITTAARAQTSAETTSASAEEKLVDVLELNDIPSPVKISSNGYAYDGPPYNSGTSDPLGKLSIKEDGLYRLQISDLFGGTRSDPANIYRLVIRRAAPDFALVAWALHMELRNGDRNALSKPLALRGGATMALEVVAFRRDGFDGPIRLSMEGLPPGVSATGLDIPAGQSRGLMLVTAQTDTDSAFAQATFVGHAEIAGAEVTRPCRLASVSWPIRDSWGEIPYTRLLGDIPVSISGNEQAPLTIVPAQRQLEVTVNDKVVIPLLQTRRSEFSGASMQLRPIGAAFQRGAALTLKFGDEPTEAVLDLANLKIAPGDYLVAFHGGAVAKYRHNLAAVAAAESARDQAKQQVNTLDAELQQATLAVESSSEEQKAAAEKVRTDLAARLNAAQDQLTAAEKQLSQATETAKPTDIVDIIVSEPVAIRVKPAEAK